MRFIIQLFGFGSTGLAAARQKIVADDGDVAGDIFVRPESWSASEFCFSGDNATSVPAAGKPQKPVVCANAKSHAAPLFEQPEQNRTATDQDCDCSCTVSRP
jgi:hypothetical protein